MSLKNSVAFSLIFIALGIAGRVPYPAGQSFPSLAVEESRAAASVSARGDERYAGNSTSSQPLKYVNPVYVDPDDRFSKDPSVIEHEGKYYMYYFGFTSGGRQAIKVASSVDLVRWNFEGVTLEARKDGGWDADLIWAPEVVYRDGLFYMYYSGGRALADGNVDWSTLRIGLAVSRKPAGKFMRSGEGPVLLPPFGNGVIDAAFFADDDGRDYLYYVVQTSDHGHWEGIRVQRVEGMTNLKGDAKVLDPTVEWEANIVEAPTVFKANGYYYLLYSGGASDYGQRIGYAFSRVPMPSRRDGAGAWLKQTADSAPKVLIDYGSRWADIAVGSTALVIGPARQMHAFYQGKNDHDGKFQLGLARLSLDGLPTPVRFAK